MVLEETQDALKTCEIPAMIAADEIKPIFPKKKSKKKKASYKSMMSGMLNKQSNLRDIEREKEDLRKVTGGGAFTKIDKI